MPTFIKTGYWDKLSKAPKGYLNLDLITGGGSATSVTKTEFDALVSSNGLTPGAYYLISGVDVPLYGGTTILIQAATTNTLALAGHGIFYNPKYLNSQDTPNNGYGIWNGLTSYAVGDTVIWGGRHWTNLNGDDGYSEDKYTLSSDAWAIVPFNSTDYNVVADVIHYDYEHDMIVRRKDKWNNDVDGNFELFTNYIVDNGWNPIKDFQWGNGPEDYNMDSNQPIGVYSNLVKNSYLECINFIGASINSNYLINGSEIRDNITNNFGSIDRNYLNNSYITSNIILTNNSYIGLSENTLNGSYIEGNSLDIDCSINRNTLSDSYINFNILTKLETESYGSIIQNNSLSNNSSIGRGEVGDEETEGNILNSGSITNNELSNSSNIILNTLNENGRIQYNTIDNFSAINNNTITGISDINGNKLSIRSEIRNNILNAVGVYISFNSLSQYSYIDGNTISYPYTRIENNNLSIYSLINSNSLVYGNINFNTLSVTSEIGGNTLTNNSGIIAINMSTNSIVSSNIIDDSQLRNSKSFSSNIQNNNFTSSSYEGNILNLSTLFGATLINISTFSSNILNTSVFDLSSSGTLSSKSLSKINAEYVDISGINISAATIIFNSSYPRQLFINSGLTPRLGYYNASDVFTVVNVNA